MFKKTKHAATRSCQRGISDEAVNLALTFGQERWAGKGCLSIYLDKAAKQEIKELMGSKRFARVESQLSGLYLIVTGDKIVTTARTH